MYVLSSFGYTHNDDFFCYNSLSTLSCDDFGEETHRTSIFVVANLRAGERVFTRSFYCLIDYVNISVQFVFGPSVNRPVCFLSRTLKT